LYTNESGIGEEITQRLENLRLANQLENDNESYYGTNKEHDLDGYENEGYVNLFEGESDEFNIELGEED
jgi:hypothetical protein